MAGNMPPGFGRRPGDHAYIDPADPVQGCDTCGETMAERHGACPTCGSEELVPV